MTAPVLLHPAPGPKAGPGPSEEFPLRRQDFACIRAIAMRDAGIALAENKTGLVYSRLARRLRRLGLRNFSQYCALVTGPDGAQERQEMIAALTTNVTRFFREAYHFEHLRSRILPGLVQAAKRRQRVRLWSAACSSGQEPYSMALTLLSAMPDAARYDIKILATDIDPNVLAAGRAGIYEAAALADVSAAWRRRWFAPVADGSGRLGVAEELRALLAFRQLNLIGPWPMQGKFQAIFCRNVVIYFENEMQRTIWARLVPRLAAQGALYIGHSERIEGPAQAALRSDGVTIYRLQDAAGGPA